MVGFFKDYLREYPDAKLNRPEFYTFHPVLQDGDNVFCVLDSVQRIVGFAPLFPATIIAENAEAQPLNFWTIILASAAVVIGPTKGFWMISKNSAQVDEPQGSGILRVG